MSSNSNDKQTVSVDIKNVLNLAITGIDNGKPEVAKEILLDVVRQLEEREAKVKNAEGGMKHG